MIRYLILCPADTSWTLSTEAFTINLKERWPDAKVRLEARVAGIALDWSIPCGGGDLLGYFSRDGLTVGLEGPFECCASYACWYRTLVPPEVPLLMMEQGYHEVYPLAPDITPDDILSDRIVLRPPPDPQILFTRTR